MRWRWIGLRANRSGYPPGKALARKAIPANIRSLCRAYTEESIRHLAAIMRQPEYPPAARVQAANILLDRGWGKAPQSHVGKDDGDVHGTIRQIVEEVPTREGGSWRANSSAHGRRKPDQS